MFPKEIYIHNIQHELFIFEMHKFIILILCWENKIGDLHQKYEML